MTTHKKHIPALRFVEFKDDWKWHELRDLLIEFRLGGNYANDELESGIPLIKMGNLGRGDIVLNKIQYVSNTEVINSKDQIKYGDLFFNTRNTLELVGKVAIWRNELPLAYYNSNLMYMKFENNFFMNYRLNSFAGLKALRRLATGTTSVAAIYTKDLLKLKFIVPSLPEQQKIAAFLSAIDEKIQQLTSKKSLLEQYKKGVMQQLFSGKLRFKDENGKAYPKWEKKRLGEIISNKSEKYNPQKDSKSYKCIELEHLSTNTGLLLGYADSASSSSIKNKFVKGDVLFGKLRPYLRKFLLAPFDGVCTSEIWVLKGNGVSNDFLFRIIQTKEFVDLTNQSTGSKMPRADWNVVSTKSFGIPVLAEQQKIATYLSALDTKIETVAAQIGKTQEFKKGLLQKMLV